MQENEIEAAQAAASVKGLPASTTTDDELLAKLREAVKQHNEAKAAHEASGEVLTCRAKEVGAILIEARQGKTVREFDAFLKKAELYSLPWAYEAMALAGGRKTVEQHREDAAERQRQSRERKRLRDEAEAARALPKPEPEPEPEISVTQLDVTETADDAEASAEKRKAEYAATEDRADADEPRQTVTKAELMAALKVINGCFYEDDECGTCIKEIVNTDIELYEALQEARESIRELSIESCTESVREILDARKQAEGEELKAQNKIAYQKAREIEPQIRERAKAVGYDLLKVRAATFYLRETGSKWTGEYRVTLDRIDKWLNDAAEEQAATQEEAA